MKYAQLVELYTQLESTTKKLEKRDYLAAFLKETPQGLLSEITLLVQGRVFPPWKTEELGVAENLMFKTLSRVTGRTELEVKKVVTKHGDFGEATEDLLQKKKQATLSTTELTVQRVFEVLQKIPSLSGLGSVDQKIGLLSELLTSATPTEGKYLVRTVLEEMRIGTGEGIMRNAIAQAYEIPEGLVERAYSVRNDYGEIAKLAAGKGSTALEKITLEIGRPLKPMLAQKVEHAQEGLDAMGGEAAFEIKYDGMRVQVHIKGEKIKVFTRRLDDVTKQFPDIVAAAKESVQTQDAILEGEAVGVDPKTKRPQPFQKLSQRIKRKYDIEKLQKELPVEVNLFDLLYLHGKSMLSVPYHERWIALEKIVKPVEYFHVAEHMQTRDAKEVEAFLEKAVATGHEGLMIKNLDAPYTPGSRVKHMYKLKPTQETLDLVILGALHGEGRRSKWLGSFILGARDADSGEFEEVGKVATGLTDEDLQALNYRLTPLITTETTSQVTIRPELVVEIGYEEIQRSPTYESGYALRFPRVKRIREDKGSEDADTIEKIAQLFEEQRHHERK